MVRVANQNETKHRRQAVGVLISPNPSDSPILYPCRNTQPSAVTKPIPLYLTTRLSLSTCLGKFCTSN